LTGWLSQLGRRIRGIPAQGIVYTCCFALLLASNGISLRKTRDLRAEVARRPVGISTAALAQLRALRLSHRPAPMDLTESKHPYLLIFFFSPFDCPAAVEELETLEKLRASRPDIAIYGLMFGVNWDEARRTEENFGLHFPVLADETGALRTVFRPPQTPWKALLDGKNLAVLKEDGPGLSSSEKEAFFTRMNELGRR
jgi:hypothetical protein